MAGGKHTFSQAMPAGANKATLTRPLLNITSALCEYPPQPKSGVSVKSFKENATAADLIRQQRLQSVW